MVPSQNNGPLDLAIPDPELTGMLLKAGADPNRREAGGRPPWWDALSSDSDEAFETLKLLLDHGADVTLRDGEGGPVAHATYHAWMSHSSSWRAVQLLIERGAGWKGEQAYGRTVADMFTDALKEREDSGGELPGPMAWIKAKFAGDST
jgi:hypothetical protein